MEAKIEIPNNCELIKDGNTYIVKEKKQVPPRSWEEFCEKYPIKNGEACISLDSVVLTFKGEVFRDAELDKLICPSKEEAEAFLALIQLRQLRKAWVGDWKTPIGANYGVIYPLKGKLHTAINSASGRVLSFPTLEIAENFLNCFRGLCETAKILL